MRYHTTTRQVLDDDGKQIVHEQVDIPFTPEEEAEWDAMEAAEAARYKGPASVSMRQARLALLGAGLLDTVDVAIAQAGGAAKIEWEYATEVRRDAPLVTQMGQMLNMDSAALDALFVQAVTL